MFSTSGLPRSGQQFEIPVMVAALAVLPVAIVEQIAGGGWTDISTEILNWRGCANLWGAGVEVLG